MRTLRPDGFALSVVCAIIFVLLLAAPSLVNADGERPPAYSFKTPPLPPVTRPYRLPAGTELPTAILCMKMLPDGSPVCVNRKTVVGISNGDLFIEEADRSAGIRVICNSHYPPVQLHRGHVVTFWGTMGTRDAERVIYAHSEFDCDLSAYAQIGSLGLSSPGISGWPISYRDPDAARYVGLMPIGLLVRVWGKVTAKELTDEEGMWYVYLDDGWSRKDGNEQGIKGIRVYSDTIPLPGQNFQSALGVCTTKTIDPTPFGPDGDEFVIPVIRTTELEDLQDLSHPGPSANVQIGPVSGTVRLVGQPPPGIDVRVYSQYDSVVVRNVTDEGSHFTLQRISSGGTKVSAAAPGYASATVDAVAGDNAVSLVLNPAERRVELYSDHSSIRTCSDETATLTVMLRDCEGKGLMGQVRLTTTMGSFVDSQSREIVVDTDSAGFAEVALTAAPDGVGVAAVRAEPFPGEGAHSQTEVSLVGTDIAVAASRSFMHQPGSSVITAKLVDGEEPVSNGLVTFNTDDGVFQETGTNTFAAYSGPSGEASATLVLSGPGTAKVLARYSNECGHETFGWVVVACTAPAWYPNSVLHSNPLVADLDGGADGKKQVVVITSAGMLTVLNSDGTVKWYKTLHPPGSNTAACLPMDMERTGLPCIFVPAESQQKVYGYGYDGRPLAGWPTASNYRFIKVAASIGDINRDGTPEIVAGDECCYVFSWNPTGDWMGTGLADNSFLWRNLTGTPSTAIFGSTCALGDVDGDPLGIPDVVVGTNRAPEMYGFPGDPWGDFISDPLYLPGWPKNTNSRVETSPAIGDVDGDGRNDVVVGADDGNLYVLRSVDGAWAAYKVGGQMKSSPALCDLDGDGVLDIVFGAESGRMFALKGNGEAVDGWSGGILLNSQGSFAIESSPTIGDVTGDGEVNVVVGCNDGNVYALYRDGINHRDGNGTLTGPIAWVRSCLPTGQTAAKVMTAPVIDDLDGDGKVDVVAAGDQGVFVFRLDVPYVQDPALYPWPTFHRDNQRTGNAAGLPEPIRASIQGIVRHNGAPISNARVYVFHEDESPVPIPHTDPPAPRSYVLTVGSAGVDEHGKGAYCISQLEPDRTYKLKVVVTGMSDTWVTVDVGVGLKRVDIDL